MASGDAPGTEIPELTSNSGDLSSKTYFDERIPVPDADKVPELFLQ